MFFIVFFILGSIWGSFSNVCIHRLPKDQSVTFSRSHCPKCKNTIRWYDNIPLISYLILKAKCRYCNYKINIQYFVVELLSAFTFVLIYYFYGLSITSFLLIILTIFFPTTSPKEPPYTVKSCENIHTFLPLISPHPVTTASPTIL